MADASKLKRKNSLGSPPPEDEASPNLHEPEVPSPPVLNLEQAAQATGKSRSAIQEALKAGRLRGKPDARGEWEIDVEDLFRPSSLRKTSSSSAEKNIFPLLKLLQEQLRESHKHLEQACEREAQALERERESRERETRLLSLLTTEQEARRCLEQKLLTVPLVSLPPRLASLGLFLSGFFLSGALSIAACWFYQHELTAQKEVPLVSPRGEHAASTVPSHVPLSPSAPVPTELPSNPFVQQQRSTSSASVSPQGQQTQVVSPTITTSSSPQESIASPAGVVAPSPVVAQNESLAVENPSAPSDSSNGATPPSASPPS